MTIDDSLGRRLRDLDLSLFAGIPSQSLSGDRRSWLAVQRSVRSSAGYVYLEIGSHLGGSVQQHLVDPWCRRIISIDKRPLSQPDDRGEACPYEGNSTARMMDNLRAIAPDQLPKVTCHDSDARDVNPEAIGSDRPDFCFIDGEHTHAAVLSDFEFCLRVCAPNAAICFHDDYITFRALETILASLRRRRIPFNARKLDELTFGIFLRDCSAVNDPYIRQCSRDGARWLRGRRFRTLIPGSIRPYARNLARSVRRTLKVHLKSARLF
ncbi:MAG: class I SAM-dependent methyltransferase [Acidobacteriota bacterium]